MGASTDRRRLQEAPPSVRALLTKTERDVGEIVRRQSAKGLPLETFVVFVVDVHTELGRRVSGVENSHDGVCIFATSIPTAKALLIDLRPDAAMVFDRALAEGMVRVVVAAVGGFLVADVPTRRQGDDRPLN